MRGFQIFPYRVACATGCVCVGTLATYATNGNNNSNMAGATAENQINKYATKPCDGTEVYAGFLNEKSALAEMLRYCL